MYLCKSTKEIYFRASFIPDIHKDLGINLKANVTLLVDDTCLFSKFSDSFKIASKKKLSRKY